MLMLKGNLKQFKNKIDYAEYGGAPLLGIDGIVIIGHGRSNQRAVKNAVRAAIREVEHDLNGKIKRKVDEICQDSGVRQVLTA